MTPSENIKIKLQINKKEHGSVFKIGKEVLSQNGLLGLYKGFWVTFNRDVISYGVYFWVYYRMKDFLSDNGKLTSLNLFIAGGLAGVISWFNCYPFKYIYNLSGVRGLFVGVNPVLIRAFLVHSTVFRVNEICRDFFNLYLI